MSKLGGGWDNNNGQGPLKTAGNGKVDFNAKTQQLSDGIVKNLKFLGADRQILTAGKSGKVPPGQVNGTGNVAEAFRYFFHPDHLGSTSYITDASGEVYQHLEYFAFGETFVDEHSNTNKTPYLFNGKESDDETGLYYGIIGSIIDQANKSKTNKGKIEVIIQKRNTSERVMTKQEIER